MKIFSTNVYFAQMSAQNPDFSGQNLRGRSFKGQNLEGANFSYADIRSANFTGANLRGANFTGAKAGLQRRWVVFLLIISLLMLGISSFLSLFNGALIAYIFDSSQNIENQVAGWTTLIITVIIYIIIIRIGIAIRNIGAVAGSFAVAIAIAVAGVFAVAVAFVIAVVVAVAIAGAFAGAVAVVAFAGAFAGAFAIAFAIAGGGAVAVYVAWRAMKGDEKYALVRSTAVALAAIGGTSFRGTDLTDADFTSARLKSTDFREAKLIRTCFHKTKLLDRIRPGSSYLQHPQVLQLILTGKGQDKKFDRLNLRGINLKKTFLTDASFIVTDLSEACLQEADLSRVKLVQTQLDGTDFTGATLTGAYIEDWGITNQTKFHGARCEYVYMRLPTKEKPDPLRKPDNNAEVFKDGEFDDFIKPMFDTLDLYHNQGVDPRAIAISFNKLAENNPDAELRIAGMEVRGKNEDKVLLRAKTAPKADKSLLSAEYFEIYNQVKALTQQEVQALMAEKDNRISSLENFVTTALKSPSFYAEGNTNMSGERNIDIGSGNYNERIGGDYHQNSGINQNISGGTMYGGMQAAQGDGNHQTMDTNVVSPQQQQNLASAAAEIQALLEQLDKTYPTDTTMGKMELAARAIAQIESNPTLTARILSALKIGSVKAFEQFLNHPAASFVIGALEDWEKTKGN